MRTLFAYFERIGLVPARVAFVSRNDPIDLEYAAYFRARVGTFASAEVAVEPRLALDTRGEFEAVSQERELAQRCAAEVFVDLTPGPKDRSAALFAAASAIPGVRVLYSRREDGHYATSEVAPLGDLNLLLAPHGSVFRNYTAELRQLPGLVARATEYHRISDDALDAAIADLLLSAARSDGIVGARTNLLALAEATSRKAVPALILRSPKLTSEAVTRAGQEWHRSAGWAAQAVYQLRCLLAHPRSREHSPTEVDVVMLLELLVFLTDRLCKAVDAADAEGSLTSTEANGAAGQIAVAVDGDDVGRAFEARLAACETPQDVVELSAWSTQLERDLGSILLDLSVTWAARYIARTGDGFLVSVPKVHLDAVVETFRPALHGLTATTGIGHTVKEAYLALKIGKARNRGGGTLYALPHGESTLWTGSAGAGAP